MYFTSVFIHIIAAAIWIGGMVFFAIVLLPAIRKHPEKAMLIHAVGLKFRLVGWPVLSLLLITGLYNIHIRQIPLLELTDSKYGRLILYKLILFLTTIVISAIHDFYIGMKATEIWMTHNNENDPGGYRAFARWAGRINLLLALTAAGIGVAFVRGL
ncbi:MAG: CopD family protein [Bacteroidetes bacterium]|nr:CopD family protein [Bacteroidota bacterium]